MYEALWGGGSLGCIKGTQAYLSTKIVSTKPYQLYEQRGVATAPSKEIEIS